MNENSSLKLHDIKDIVEIPDNSIFIFIALVILVLTLLILLTVFLIRFIKNKKPNARKEYFKILDELTFENSKKDDYTITKYVRLLATTSREKKLANELIEDLEKYKYKKEVSEEINTNIKAKLSTFLDVIDV